MLDKQTVQMARSDAELAGELVDRAAIENPCIDEP
jgi:hypothetical protein